MLLDATPGHLRPVGMHTPLSLEDVIVESSFAQSTAVFGGGQATAMWSLTSPGVSLAPEDNVAVFTVRLSQGGAKAGASQPLFLISPKVQVSDAKVVDVILTKELQTGPAPLVLIARHVCKERGASQVTISLPQGYSGSQVAFSYRKVCKSPPGFGLLQFPTTGLSLLHVHSFSRWDVPTYGWRVLLVSAFVCILGVVIHEFGHHYMSKKITQHIQESLGPDMFGTQIEVGSITFRPWTGVFIMKDFKIKNPPGFEGDYLLFAEEVCVLFAPKRVLYTMGRKFDILLLRLSAVHVEIEFPSYLMGPPNISVVRHNLSDSQQRYADEQAELTREGVQPGFFARQVSTLMECAKLDTAEFLDITAHSQSFLGSVSLNISDMHFENFSKVNDAVGMTAIFSQLIDTFYQTIKRDTLGDTGSKVFSAAESAVPASPQAGSRGRLQSMRDSTGGSGFESFDSA